MGLPIVDDRQALYQDRRDAVVLAAAQRMLDEGRADDAKRELAALAQDPTTAVRAHATLLYAGVALMTGACDAALAALAALARLPAEPGFPIEEGYRHMIEACALRQARRYDEALAAARKSLEHGSTSGRLLVLADAQKHAGHVDDAIRTLTTLLAREPANSTAWAQLAGYRNLAGDADGGRDAFGKFRACSDGGADAHRNAAFYFATLGDVDATVHALEQASVREPAATASYIADEIELERFRDHARFAALRR